MPPMTSAAIETTGLIKIFGDNHAVDGVDLTVPAGAVYGLLGPNGAGKTTVVRVLATLLRPDGGTARVFGHDPMYWYRLEISLGRNSIVGTTVRGTGTPFGVGDVNLLPGTMIRLADSANIASQKQVRANEKIGAARQNCALASCFLPA